MVNEEPPPFTQHFPFWLRQIDPLLIAEDTNGIYHAMESLRIARKKRRRFFQSQPSTTDSGAAGRRQLGLIFLTFALFFATLATLGLTRRWLKKLLLEVSRPQKSALSAIPPFLGQIFGAMSYVEQAAYDIWMTGAGGWSVVEASYLQQRREWKMAMVIGIIIVFGILTFLAGMAYASLNPSPAWPFAACAVILFLLDCFFRVGKMTLSSQTMGMDLMISQWITAAQPFITEAPKPKAHRTWLERIKQFFKGIFQIAALMIFLFAIIVIGILVFWGIRRLFVGAGISNADVRGGIAWILLIAAFGLGLLVRHASRRPKSAEDIAKAEKLDRERRLMAEYAFNLYMAVVIARDEDGVKWARETYADGYRISEERKEEQAAALRGKKPPSKDK